MGFLAGRLKPRDRDRIVDHVDACSRCALLLELPDFTPERDGAPGLGGDALVTAFQPGAVLAGRYRVARLLGVGGMGEVYEALDLSLGMSVALKTVRATAADDARAVDRLKAEALLARRVTHANVCRIFDFAVHPAAVGGGAPAADAGGAPPVAFITMELLPGATLARHLSDRRAIPVAGAIEIARQLAEGLRAAHEAGVIHKDLKSENVMLAAPVAVATGLAPRAVITDFGLAATRSLEGWTGGGARFSGTPGYVAPERRSGAPATEAGDVYSLGVIFMDMAAGRPDGGRRRAPPSEVLAGGFAALAMKCQAADSRARPTLADVLRALEKLRRRSASVTPGRVRRALVAAAGSVAAAALAAAIVFARLRATGPTEAVPQGGRALAPIATAAALSRPAPSATAAVVPAAPPGPAPAAATPAPARAARAGSASRARRLTPSRAVKRHPASTGAVAVAGASAPAAAAAQRPAPLDDQPVRRLAEEVPAANGAGDDAPITTLSDD